MNYSRDADHPPQIAEREVADCVEKLRGDVDLERAEGLITRDMVGKPLDPDVERSFRKCAIGLLETRELQRRGEIGNAPPEDADRDFESRLKYALQDALFEQRTIDRHAANPMMQALGEDTLEWLARLQKRMTRAEYARSEAKRLREEARAEEAANDRVRLWNEYWRRVASQSGGEIVLVDSRHDSIRRSGKDYRAEELERKACELDLDAWRLKLAERASRQITLRDAASRTRAVARQVAIIEQRVRCSTYTSVAPPPALDQHHVHQRSRRGSSAVRVFLRPESRVDRRAA